MVSLLALVLASCTASIAQEPPRPTIPHGGPTDGRLIDIGRDITDYVQLLGDQVVVVPNGQYRAGTVTAPHAATNGPLRGWLVLKAQSMHGVVVDLAGAPLTLEGSTSRVLFVGFRFVNGPIFANGSDLAFWYTDHSFPADVWARQGGRYNSADTVHVYSPSSKRVEFYGSDLHDTGDAIDVSNSTDTRLEGVRIWELGDMGVDPQDKIHADAIDGVGGNTDGLTVVDSYIKGRVMLEDWNGHSGGAHADMRFERTWVSNSPSAGFTFVAVKPSGDRGLFGSFTDVRTWANHNGFGRIDIVDGQQHYASNTVPSRVNVSQDNYSTQAPPAGASSPADQWRDAHGYDDWFYAIG